ncbi:rod shape-determining protein MreC [Variovorax sp. VNK109]|uniref:rod shape-determining protein MreC n=1 Tax=Variovorax sp. VNK109 TaxID=3400919 RepID=UPI003BFD5364
MPLGTLDRTPPPFFKQGPSALSKLIVFSALALFLMVADTRLNISQPIRTAVATVLYPVQWLALRPVLLLRGGGQYFADLQQAQQSDAQSRERLAKQAQRANQVEELAGENERLRRLLGLRERVTAPGRAAEVLHEAADPYSRKVIIDKGLGQGVQPGSAVIDEFGVLGQVTRVYPLLSEVTLVIDRDLSIPVLNTRTNARNVAFGEPSRDGGALELRFIAANADVKEGDLLVTSGVDGVYPGGLPVARVDKVERRAESAFARIYCTPLALVGGARYVVVLDPVGKIELPKDEPASTAGAAKSRAPAKKGPAP